MINIAKYVFIDPFGSIKGLNAGIGYLVSSLAEEGINDIKVLDFNNNSKEIDARFKKELEDCSFLGFSLKSSSNINRLLYSPHIKNKNNKIYACGGPHISLDGLNFLKENRIFDIGVIGEGEETIKKISKCIENQCDFSKINNIIHNSNGKITQNKCENFFIRNLDKLPFPNYDPFDSFCGVIEKYPLLTSRGCPYNCIYCSVGKVSGKVWRYRSAENIIEELLYAKEKYRIKTFSILDDNFTLNVERAKQICEMIIDKKMNLKWDCPNGIRADRIDAKLAKLMKKAGCQKVFLGIESGVEEVFNSIKKGETLEDIKKSVKIIKKEGIKVGGFFIIGLPGSTLEKEKKSLEFSKELELDSTSWGLLIPYPGTQVWEYANKDGRIIRDWKEGFHVSRIPKVVFETKEFTEKERVYIYYYAHIKSRNYSIFFNPEDTFLIKLRKILKAIIKYDKRNLHNHLYHYIYQKLKDE